MIHIFDDMRGNSNRILYACLLNDSINEYENYKVSFMTFSCQHQHEI